MRTSLLFTCLLIFGLSTSTFAQTEAEMEAERAAKKAELDSLQARLKATTTRVNTLKGEIAGLTDKLTPYPRWKKGLGANLGLNFSNFNNWFPKDQPSTTAMNIGFATTGFANADYEKAFWRNRANLTLGWLKFDNRDNPDDEDGFQVAADAFNLTSLYGLKITPKLAASVLGEYRTSILDGKFNDPGYLDLGTGFTWTPTSNLAVVVHPLNYNFVFAEEGSDFDSSLGAKVVADYASKITKNLNWTSNLSAFVSYQGSDLSNWTWVNTFSTAVKGIGVGLDVGLRSNQQEATAAGNSDNPLQTYWILGLTYAIAK
jgi:hypothetical protein